MRTVLALMNRNRKLFFKDKGMLFTSMITPVILIVLYATFLAKVFRDSFTAAIPDMITISDKNHMLHGVFMEMERKHYPDEMVEAIRATLDCNPVFHGNVVGVNQMIGIMMGSIAVFGIIYYFVTLLPDGEGGR